MSMCFLYIVYCSQKPSFYPLKTLVQLTGYVKEMVKLLKRQANLKVPSYTPFSLLSVCLHPSVLVSYLKQGQLNFALWLLTTINSCIAFPSCGDPHQNSLKTGSSIKFTISCRNLFKYPSKLVKYWRYGSKSMKEVTLYVDLLICTRRVEA